MSRQLRWVLILVVSATSPTALGRLYSYENSDGDYVISKKKPKGVDEYSILSNDGEFIRLVQAREKNVPISHWRPWYLPKDPHPFDAKPEPDERTPTVVIDEVEAEASVDDGQRD